jgi:hypothetical protein
MRLTENGTVERAGTARSFSQYSCGFSHLDTAQSQRQSSMLVATAENLEDHHRVLILAPEHQVESAERAME